MTILLAAADGLLFESVVTIEMTIHPIGAAAAAAVELLPDNSLASLKHLTLHFVVAGLSMD